MVYGVGIVIAIRSEHMKKRMVALAFALCSAMGMSSMAYAQEASATGEVRRIDAAAGKIAIKHGNIPDLKLTAMTLIYDINPSLLGGVKAGDKVDFTAKFENKKYIITKIKPD